MAKFPDKLTKQQLELWLHIETNRSGSASRKSILSKYNKYSAKVLNNLVKKNYLTVEGEGDDRIYSIIKRQQEYGKPQLAVIKKCTKHDYWYHNKIRKQFIVVKNTEASWGVWVVGGGHIHPHDYQLL